MPHVNFVDGDFNLSDENFANLPPMQKLTSEGENVEQRIIDIISGTVAGGTKIKWGVDMKTEDGGVFSIGTEDCDFFKILDISEEKPDGTGLYHVIYVYIQCDSLDLISNKQLQELDRIREAFQKYQPLIQLRSVLEKTLENTAEIRMIGVEQSALASFIDMFDDMSRKYCSTCRDPNFGGLLLFCDTCAGNDNFVTLACQAGYIKTVFLNRNQSIEKLLSKITRTQKIDRVDSDWLFQLLLEPEMIAPGDVVQSDEERVEGVKQMISRLTEWAFDHPDLKWNFTHVQRCFLNFLNVAYVENVGNLEAANVGNPSLQLFRNIKTALKNTKTAPDVTHVFSKAAIFHSSCTLSMSLTFMQLRNQDCDMFELNNTGEVGGCLCYSKAASVNQMISFVGKFKEDFKEMYSGDDPTYEFRVFNNNHCDPKINPRYASYSDSNPMFFIDIATAVSLFTKRKIRIQKKIQLGGLDDDHSSVVNQGKRQGDGQPQEHQRISKKLK